MNKPFLSLLLLMGISSLEAGHFYNACDENDLGGGATINRSASMGFSDSHQAVLISPRLAVTAPHTSAGDKSENFSISFYGQPYRVIHSIDRPGLQVCVSDLRIYVLDRDVVHPDGAPPCLPVLTQIREVSGPYSVIGHSLSHSPHIRLKGQNPRGNGRHSILYGRTHINFAREERNDTDIPDFDDIRVGQLSACPDKDMMVPIGGDSGSPLYVSLRDGGCAVWGVLSGVDAGQGLVASYTSLSQNIGWLQTKETHLINRGLLPHDVIRIQTVSQDEWDDQGQCLTLPPEFDPDLYLDFNEDVAAAAKDHPTPLQFARDHYMTHGRREKRDWRLPAAFSTQLYLAYNDDLQNAVRALSETQKDRFLIHHFARHGRHEARLFSLPDDFDPIVYLALNPDVAKVAHTHQDPLTFATQHFKMCGIKEKRPYFDAGFKDFDPKIYLALNPDVAEAAKTSPNADRFALWHFTTNALHENRRCKNTLPQDFDPQQYVVLNFDLSLYLADHPELDLEIFAIRHYQTYGSVLEGRSYK